MSQSTRQLVSKIQNLVSKPQAHWTPIHQSLANEYTSLVSNLCDRATVVDFQWELGGIDEAKIALRHPTDLMEELRLLHFPTSSIWINMLKNRGINPRPLPEIAPLIVISQKLSSASNVRSGTKKRNGPPPIPGSTSDFDLEGLDGDMPVPVTRRLKNEAGFAPKGSSATIRMLPLAIGIMVISLGLLSLAIIGPMLMKPKDGAQANGENNIDKEPLDPKELLIPKDIQGNPPIPDKEIVPEKNEPRPLLKKANVNPLPDPKDKPEPIPEPAKKAPPKVEAPAKPEPMEIMPKALAPGMVASAEIAQLGALLSKNGANGSTIKTMLELDADTANQKSLNRFLSFVRSDLGLVGRKNLSITDFLEMAGWQKPLETAQASLFDPERLGRIAKGYPRSEEELSSWMASVILTPNAFVLVDPKRKSIQLEVLLGLAANEKVMADLLDTINKKVITEMDPKTGTPTKIAVRYEVMLQQKRDLKNRTNSDLCQDISVIRGELARRLKAIGHTGIK